MKTQKNFKTEYKHIISYTVIAFLVLSTIFLTISTAININENSIHKEGVIQNETRIVNIEKDVFSNKISNIVSDLLYIADSFKINETDSDYSKIEDLWLAFSKRKKIYDQIRYIDANGNEIIRVNYSDDGPYLTDSENLQNKSSRYYFTKTMSLDKYQVYISQIDLNVENDILEEPIKPTIRISVPYYNNEDELQGIIILNYLANNLLEQVDKIAKTSLGHIDVLNADSYWIFNNSNTSSEWGFMYEDRLDKNFKNDFFDEWNTISNNKEGTLITDSGVYNYTSLLTSEEITVKKCEYSLTLEDNELYIISHIDPEDSWLNLVFYQDTLSVALVVLSNSISIYVVLLIISLVFALLATANKLKKDRLKYFSEYDTMTGTYNRRAGFEILRELSDKAKRENHPLSICFIDINGLKSVNDSFGHDKGDELILSVVSSINTNVRETDYVIRLGGDEFLIIFDNLDEKKAEMIWQRIKDDYDKINATKERKYLISASHGIKTYLPDSKNSIDDIINQADEKMYNEKKIIKKDLEIIRKDI